MKKLRALFLSFFVTLVGVTSLSLNSCVTSLSSTSELKTVQILNGDEITILVGETIPLQVDVGSLTDRITYVSTDEEVAIVNLYGVITAKNPGRTTIIVSCGDYQDTILVKVVRPKEPITLNFIDESPVTVEVGEVKILRYNLEGPNDMQEPEVVIEDESIISLRATDFEYHSIIVEGLKEGTTTLTLWVEGVSDSLEITVPTPKVTSLTISSEKDEMRVGTTQTLSYETTPNTDSVIPSFKIIEGEENARIEGTELTAIHRGKVVIQAVIDGITSNSLEISIYDFEATMGSDSILLDDYERIKINHYDGNRSNLLWKIEDEAIVKLELGAMGDFFCVALKVGETSLYFYDAEGNISNTLHVKVIDGKSYENVTKEEFYSNYERATSYVDAMYRTEKYFMSGDIEVPDQEPTIATDQPSKDGMLIHNSRQNYSNQGNTYTVVDKNGDKAFDIYYGAAYTSLEEVAAYIYAWGTVPVNYEVDRDMQPYMSPWGEYLRLNNTEFSGDPDRFPYEPELPGITGFGGNIVYYEVDIGTTGTDCDPRYPSRIYNDGDYITRGAARIVYSSYYADTRMPVDPEDRYVFYTYNHYNDFQEYLNYENGWGTMFGNITGGGVISSKNPSECNPTPFVPTIRTYLP